MGGDGGEGNQPRIGKASEEEVAACPTWRRMGLRSRRQETCALSLFRARVLLNGRQGAWSKGALVLSTIPRAYITGGQAEVATLRLVGAWNRRASSIELLRSGGEGGRIGAAGPGKTGPSLVAVGVSAPGIQLPNRTARLEMWGGPGMDGLACSMLESTFHLATQLLFAPSGLRACGVDISNYLQQAMALLIGHKRPGQSCQFLFEMPCTRPDLHG